MGTACYFSWHFLNQLVPDHLLYAKIGKGGPFLGRSVRMGVLSGEGLLIVILAAKVFHLTEATEVIDIFTEKVKNKLRRNST